MAGAPDDDLKQLHDALLRACEDYDADEAIRALGSAAVAIIGSVQPEAHQAVGQLAGVMHAVLNDVMGPVGGTKQ